MLTLKIQPQPDATVRSVSYERRGEMAHAATRTGDSTYQPTVTSVGNPAHQAYLILRVAFVLAPVVAGVDKFAHVLVNWDMYLAPTLARLLPMTPHTFMLAVGAVEILAGVLVAVLPTI